MSSGSGLLAECAQQLRSSSHDYEKLLGGSVDGVWRAVSGIVERQLRLRKGVGVPYLGKFALIRDVEPPSPVFLLADRLVSSYSIAWRRPPPALLTPVADLSLSVVGSDAGGLPKDQVAKTLDAIVTFLGTRLHKGTASGKLRVGNVGAFIVEGKSLSFQFDASFISQIRRVNNDATPSSAPMAGNSSPSPSRGARTKQEPHAGKNTTTTISISVLPRAASLQVLMPVANVAAVAASPVDQVSVEEDPNHAKRRHRSRHHHRHKHRTASGEEERLVDDGSASTATHIHHHHHHLRQSKSTGQLEPVAGAAGDPTATLQVTDQAALRAAGSGDAARIRVQTRRIGAPVGTSAAQSDEIERRTHATRLRCVQERAQRTVTQRDLDAFLSAQIHAKHHEKQRLHALDATATDYDAVRLLPRDPIVTHEQRRAVKDKLRGRLHDQVALKDTLARQRRDIERGESEYFMAKVNDVAARELAERRDVQRITREALTAGWQQQRAMADQIAAIEAKRRL